MLLARTIVKTPECDQRLAIPATNNIFRCSPKFTRVKLLIAMKLILVSTEETSSASRFVIILFVIVPTNGFTIKDPSRKYHRLSMSLPFLLQRLAKVKKNVSAVLTLVRTMQCRFFIYSPVDSLDGQSIFV